MKVIIIIISGGYLPSREAKLKKQRQKLLYPWQQAEKWSINARRSMLWAEYNRRITPS